MYRITRTIFICKDGSMEQSTKAIEVADLDAFRERLKGDKYVKINFLYSEINDKRENRDDMQTSSSENDGGQ